jgi:hypothetical protein
MLYRKLLKLKRTLRASQTWKLHIGIFIHWKVLWHSMHKFYNRFLQNLESHTLCWMCTTFLKSWNWLMHIMRPPSRSRPQFPTIGPTRSSHSFSRAKPMHSATPILPFYNYYANHAHKANECNIHFEDFFWNYCGNEGHQKAVCFAKFLEWK